jgi:four helix bundle protein
LLGFSDGSRCALLVHMTAPTYQAYGQDIRDRAFGFACQIVEYCDDLMKRGGAGRVLAPQLLRCGTSIGANLEEARGGESRRDFISKCSIALKEARESLFRLRVADRLSARQAGESGRARRGGQRACGDHRRDRAQRPAQPRFVNLQFTIVN